MLKLVCLCATFLLLLGICSANTEIINLSVAEDYSLDLPFTETWLVLKIPKEWIVFMKFLYPQANLSSRKLRDST